MTLAAALLPQREPDADTEALPSISLVVPVFNEAAGLPRLFAALGELDYPQDRLSIILIDDGSFDGSAALIQAWADDRSHAQAISLRERSGKGRTLNAIKASALGELTVVCDADLRPRPTVLRALARQFADPGIGGAAAYLAPTGDDSVVTDYASLESWVHQLVTSAGKDRLRLDPPTHGCAAYRTAALHSIGWFSASGPGEDIRASMALSRSGWRTRFAGDAVADNLVVSSWSAYWHQHVRWARNLFRARGRPASAAAGRDPDALAWRLARTAERGLTSAGYTDRIVLVGAMVLGARRRIPRRVAALYPAVIALELIAAVTRAGRCRQLPRYLLVAVAGAPVDLLASVAAVTAQLLRKPHRWPADSAHRLGPINRTTDDLADRPRPQPARPP